MPEARAQLMYPVPPGAATTCVLTITAPATPGRYRLLIGRGIMEEETLRLEAIIGATQRTAERALQRI